jgi:hypothetical protein
MCSVQPLLVLCDPPQGEPPGAGLVAVALDRAEKSYQSLKAALLVAGADGQLPIAGMEEALRLAASAAGLCQPLFLGAEVFESAIAQVIDMGIDRRHADIGLTGIGAVAVACAGL